jgi:hypothetical protein
MNLECIEWSISALQPTAAMIAAELRIGVRAIC